MEPSLVSIIRADIAQDGERVTEEGECAGNDGDERQRARAEEIAEQDRERESEDDERVGAEKDEEGGEGGHGELRVVEMVGVRGEMGPDMEARKGWTGELSFMSRSARLRSRLVHAHVSFLQLGDARAERT